MFRDAKRFGNSLRRFQLETVSLAVVDRQRNQQKTFRTRNCRRSRGIESTGQQHNGWTRS